MRVDLQRVFLWLSIAGAFYLGASVLNFLWPFTPRPTVQGSVVGDVVFAVKLLLSGVGYLLLRSGKVRVALYVVGIWIVFSLLYAMRVLLFSSLSGFTVSIFLGELAICGLLAFYAMVEVRAHASPK
jgi:hypothetical protein